MYHTLGYPEREERKKIVKRNEMSEMIDGERKSKEEVLEYPRFWDV